MPEQYQSALTGPQMDQALLDMANHTSERYAKGTANGAAVPSGTVGYHDNALYYKDLAANQAQAATNAAGNAIDAAAQAEDAANRAESAIPAGSVAAVLYDRAQTLTEAQKLIARTNIGAGTGGGGGGGGGGRNLLDNYWFMPGSVVNQRNITSVSLTSTEQYTLDRWIGGANSPSTLTLSSTGLKLTPATGATCFIYQKFANVDALDGKQLTASILLRDGTLLSGTITRENGTIQYFFTSTQGFEVRFGSGNGFNIRASQTVEIVAVKLEVGDTSTLINDFPPSYSEELAKCQYYYERVYAPEGNMTMGTGSATSTALFVSIKLTPKKTTPTIAVAGGLRAGSANLNINITNTPTWQAFDPNTGNGTLNFTQSGWTSGQFYRWGIVGHGYMEFSAESAL